MSKYTKLTDEQWKAIEDIVPACLPGGRPEKWLRRDIVDAILFKFATDCSWRQIPDSYPKWNTVFVYYNRWRRCGTWYRITFTLYLPELFPSDPYSQTASLVVTIKKNLI